MLEKHPPKYVDKRKSNVSQFALHFSNGFMDDDTLDKSQEDTDSDVEGGEGHEGDEEDGGDEGDEGDEEDNSSNCYIIHVIAWRRLYQFAVVNEVVL